VIVDRYRIKLKQRMQIAMGVGVVDSNSSDYHYHHDDINRISRELFWDVEQKLLMHKLAKEYYGFR
jgi:hypothetical protein